QNSDERVVHWRGHDVVAALNIGFRPLVDQMTLRSVGFLAMSRQTYLVSFVSRLPPAQLSSQRLQMVQAAGLWPRMALNGAEKPVRRFFWKGIHRPGTLRKTSSRSGSTLPNQTVIRRAILTP